MKEGKNNEIVEKIITYSNQIHLPAVRKYLSEELDTARSKNLSYEEFLCSILEKEYDMRVDNGKLARIRIAGFPCKKYIEDLKVEELPADGANKLKMLTSLEFIKSGTNVILAGSTGTGNYRKFLFVERFSENTHKICLSINENLSIIFGNPYLQKPCS